MILFFKFSHGENYSSIPMLDEDFNFLSLEIWPHAEFLNTLSPDIKVNFASNLKANFILSSSFSSWHEHIPYLTLHFYLPKSDFKLFAILSLYKSDLVNIFPWWTLRVFFHLSSNVGGLHVKFSMDLLSSLPYGKGDFLLVISLGCRKLNN